jgi:hypothetical protein
MRAILITPETQSIEAIQVSSRDEIPDLIGFDTIESDEVGDADDRLYFDEECFIRGDAVKGRFQIDSLIPIAGKGVILGSTKDGAELDDATTDIDDLKNRIKFL